MKLIQAGSTPISEILNPRGNLAKELEMTAKKASWLSLMCGYWLAFHHDNADRAMYDEPTYNLPKQYDPEGRFNKARKECGAYERMATTQRDGVRPRWADRWYWPDVFSYWYSGGLDRGIEDLMAMLPQQNFLAIEKELLK